MPYYKRQGNSLMMAPEFVSGPGFELSHENRTNETYPTDGWYWFDTLDEAFVALTVDTPRITRAQAKAWLILNGLIDQVQPLIDAIPDPVQRALVQNDWDERLHFEADNPTLVALATGLGRGSEEEIQQMFKEAALL